MKRTREEVEQIMGIQETKASTEDAENSSSSNEEDSSSSSSSEESSSSSSQEQYPFEEFQFTPSAVERQIIRLSLATIRRSNMYDWDLDNTYDWHLDDRDEEIDHMTLCCDGYIIDDEQMLVVCTIMLSIYYSPGTTYCNITYFTGKDGKGTFHKLNMHWETPNSGSHILSLTKDETKTSCFIFSTTTTLNCDLTPEDCREDSWCYFIDARYHLNRISAR